MGQVPYPGDLFVARQFCKEEEMKKILPIACLMLAFGISLAAEVRPRFDAKEVVRRVRKAQAATDRQPVVRAFKRSWPARAHDGDQQRQNNRDSLHRLMSPVV